MTGDLADLIAALRARGLLVPEEVNDLRGLTIAIRCNGPVQRGRRMDDLDLDGNGIPDTKQYLVGGPMHMSTTRGRRPHRKAAGAR